jgi:hypothetical protein
MNKSKMFCFRLSERDLAYIQAKAEKAGLNMTSYITMTALQKEILVVNGLSDFITELKLIGRNINQLTLLCNMGRINCADLSETKEQLREVYGRLSELVTRS